MVMMTMMMIVEEERPSVPDNLSIEVQCYIDTRLVTLGFHVIFLLGFVSSLGCCSSSGSLKMEMWCYVRKLCSSPVGM